MDGLGVVRALAVEQLVPSSSDWTSQTEVSRCRVGSFGSKNLACLDSAWLVCQILVDCWLVSMSEKLVYLSYRRSLLPSSATCDDEQFPNIKCVSKWMSWQQLTCLPGNSSMGFCMRSRRSSYQGLTMDVLRK